MKSIFTIFLMSFTLLINAQKSKKLIWSTPHENIENHLIEVNEKDKDSTYLETATPVTIPQELKSNSDLHFPYPIIFIHGLTGSADTWVEFYNYALNQNWSYGGHLRFNLNSDEDFFNSNIYTNQSDVLDFNENLTAADFYLVNFNCATDGTSFGGDVNEITQSNQAAIAKQGLAIKQAIFHVLEATGRDKVILFGHSMGGLAAREYLQNSNLWQEDGNHHIAKLITSGTPHGGSNATGTFLFDAFNDLDESSDAVRDLRRSYFYSFDDGVFLHGGIEDEDVLNDSFWGFYNLDVNCNGQIGNNIIGLNQKDIYGNLDYSMIIGDWFYDISINDPGDGVVEAEDAQLKNFYPITAETFTIYSSDFTPLHTALPKNTRYNFYALDEPDYYDLAYQIEINESYNGYITPQAEDAEYSIDYDDFLFTIPEEGSVVINIENMPVNFGVSILDRQSLEVFYNKPFQSFSSITEQIYLPKGDFYLEFYGNGSNLSWQIPYAFRINWNSETVTSTTDLINGNFKIEAYPNPVSKDLIVKMNENIDGETSLTITDEMGRLIWKEEIKNKNEVIINVENFTKGVYFLNVRNQLFTETKRIIKQ